MRGIRSRPRTCSTAACVAFDAHLQAASTIRSSSSSKGEGSRTSGPSYISRDNSSGIRSPGVHNRTTNRQISSSSTGASISRRSLKQSTGELLQLVEDDDPFVGAEYAFAPGFGLLSGLAQLASSAAGYAAGFVQQQQQQWRPPWMGYRSEAGGSGAAAFNASSGNATHSYHFSHMLQMQLPQSWDTVNMTQIVRDNLEPDLLFWQQLEYVPSVADLFDQAQHNPMIANLPNTRRLVEIRRNVLRFPLMPPGRLQTDCDEGCDPQLADFVRAMRAAVEVFGLELPDVLFLLNTDDAPVCNREQAMNRECAAPVISLSKEANMADLLGPVMRRADAEVVHRHAPWASKKNKAFFRGSPSCGGMPFPPQCARSLVARLAQVSYPHLLDAGLVEPYNRPDQIEGDPVLRDGNGSLPVLPKVSMAELPDYKWLLNLDGHIAAYRLANLLATNSLVFKQQSNMVEYYYRSLRPFHHYVPIFKTSEHDLVPRLEWAFAHDELSRHIVFNANRFALTYTTYKARVLYWKYVLLAYKELVPDMEDYFRYTVSAEPLLSQPGDSFMGSLLKQLAATATPAGSEKRR
uniref:Glycosyl transferase CAP10 domain-containing protein n=1 Tax=Tetradesmus obliquus TaxID=3088 RepID=A0A383W8X9_TETOB|eukprot:jgi/Sobl393_1/7438/SZX73464.1